MTQGSLPADIKAVRIRPAVRNTVRHSADPLLFRRASVRDDDSRDSTHMTRDDHSRRVRRRVLATWREQTRQSWSRLCENAGFLR